MTAQELRQIFINFFEEKGHTYVKSSNLIPLHDPTLLFTSAGMVQFKKLWTSPPPLPYRRAVSIQKCLRTSDLEKVGKSIKYNTFFEMMGNFSFGDYFKEKAIEWAWEFVQKVVKLEEKKLYVTVLKEDELAYKVWQNYIPTTKIYKLGKEHNFWSPVGGRGACGACSEIYYDMGEEKGCKNPNCQPGCDCDRYIEVWNLVFPEFEAQPGGEFKKLRNRGIDTGMGLERLFMVVEGGETIFDLPLFKPIIEELEIILNVKYEGEVVPIFNVICDHIRALVFAITEGTYPSNTGRGYLLRHLLRRAQKLVYELGVRKPFLYKLAPVVGEIMGDCYPEVKERREGVALILKSEEESFLRTLSSGIKVFNQIVRKTKPRLLSAHQVFKLYDTYGFPTELISEMAIKMGIKVDMKGFERLMCEYKQKTREKGKFAPKMREWKVIRKKEKTKFKGYETLKIESYITRWCKVEGEWYEIVLRETPFYREKGGQVGDKGRIYNKEGDIFLVEDTQEIDGIWVHIGKFLEGEIEGLVSSSVICEVDSTFRLNVERNHTATHLLHSAIRKVVGNWVHQEGSLVEDRRLRFDFTHFDPLKDYEIKKIEDLMNSWILENWEVETYLTSFNKAIDEGVTAIFGEKYGQEVRVVKIGNISKELCGGTHVRRIGEIGGVKIISETGVHAGIRRVELISGKEVWKWFRKCEEIVEEICGEVNSPKEKVKEKIQRLIKEKEEIENRLVEVEMKRLETLLPEIIERREFLNTIEVIIFNVPQTTFPSLRRFVDKLRNKENRVGCLWSEKRGKVQFITFLSENLKPQLHAGKIAKEIGKLIEGGGGGRDVLGEGGGKKKEKMDEKFKSLIRKMINQAISSKKEFKNGPPT